MLLAKGMEAFLSKVSSKQDHMLELILAKSTILLSLLAFWLIIDSDDDNSAAELDTPSLAPIPIRREEQ